MDTVLNCLATDSVGLGDYLERFQKTAKDSLGYDFGFAVRGPDVALGLALDSLALSEGDVVALPALAPSYYASVLASRKLQGVFIDAKPDSAEPDVDLIGSLEPKPRALILYDALGILPDPEAVASIGLPVIEDMSTSLGAYRDETRAGSLGSMAILGLEHDSIVTAGGGALLLAFGRRDGTVLRNLGEGLAPEIRMTDYNAALGLAQLRDMESAIAKRRELAATFAQSLARTRHKLVFQDGEGEPGYWALPVSIASSVKDVEVYAKKKEVDCLLAFERSLIAKGAVPDGSCPNARAMSLHCLLFPLHQRIGAQSAQKIAKVLATLP